MYVHFLVPSIWDTLNAPPKFTIYISGRGRHPPFCSVRSKKQALLFSARSYHAYHVPATISVMVGWKRNTKFLRPRMLEGTTIVGSYAIRAHAGKGKCSMWLMKKVEIHVAKISFMVCKWSNLNVPASFTTWCYLLLRSVMECSFLCMLEKGKWCMWLMKKVKIHVAKIGFMVECPSSIHPCKKGKRRIVASC